MKIILIPILCFIILQSCKNETSISDSISTEKQELTNPIKKTEPDLASLYQHYHSKPSNQKQIDENKIIEYAAANNLAPHRSPSGLYYIIHEEGMGDFITRNDKITAHYKGTTLAGIEFDSSYKRKKPISFKIGQMIKGWNEAMTYMKKGSSATLLIPSHLAYGQRGYAPDIGPHEVLMFEMKILK